VNNNFGTLRKTKGSLRWIRVSPNISAQICDDWLPQSKASKTKAATSNLQAAGPPSVDASSCPLSSLFVMSFSVSNGEEGDLPAFSEMTSPGRGGVTVVNTIFAVDPGMMMFEIDVTVQMKLHNVSSGVLNPHGITEAC